jgi:hypothetical protein
MVLYQSSAGYFFLIELRIEYSRSPLRLGRTDSVVPPGTDKSFLFIQIRSAESHNPAIIVLIWV